MIVISGLSYVVIVATVTILFLITGMKILRQLKHESTIYQSSASSSRATSLKQATVKLMFSTIGLVGCLVCALIIGLTEIASLLKSGHVVWLALYVSTTFSDLMLVLAVRATLKKQNSSFKTESPGTTVGLTSTSTTVLTSSGSPASARRTTGSTRESVEASDLGEMGS